MSVSANSVADMWDDRTIGCDLALRREIRQIRIARVSG
ncbi:hypothetical protein L842_0828 [Mycobacterium intracellulare MIN_052511_1280]|nr:hypothetical protein L842_0828 [Mycobacterium intracellulare MIN_052511_1280]